jgi:hypothetical protein
MRFERDELIFSWVAWTRMQADYGMWDQFHLFIFDQNINVRYCFVDLIITNIMVESHYKLHNEL